MRATALVLATLLATGGALADEPTAPAPPPRWMPAPRPTPSPATLQEARRLARGAAIMGGIGLGALAGGLALEVVGVDFLQGERSVPQGDGTVQLQHYRGDANWAEIGVGSTLLVIGFGLFVAALVRFSRAQRLVQ